VDHDDLTAAELAELDQIIEHNARLEALNEHTPRTAEELEALAAELRAEREAREEGDDTAPS